MSLGWTFAVPAYLLSDSECEIVCPQTDVETAPGPRRSCKVLRVRVADLEALNLQLQLRQNLVG